MIHWTLASCPVGVAYLLLGLACRQIWEGSLLRVADDGLCATCDVLQSSGCTRNALQIVNWARACNIFRYVSLSLMGYGFDISSTCKTSRPNPHVHLEEMGRSTR